VSHMMQFIVIRYPFELCLSCQSAKQPIFIVL